MQISIGLVLTLLIVFGLPLCVYVFASRIAQLHEKRVGPHTKRSRGTDIPVDGSSNQQRDTRLSNKAHEDEQKTITCGVCNRTCSEYEDPEEFEEVFSLEFVGGYGSIFGDGFHVHLDICQHCLNERLGDALTTTLNSIPYEQ